MDLISQTLFSGIPLRELDAGSAAHCKAGPMKFTIRHYSLEGLGHLSVMEGSAMLGLMKMDTVILTPLHRDAPLFSYDRIRAMGNDTLILEYYDTLADNTLRSGFEQTLQASGSISGIPNHDLGSHWYDPLKLKCSVSKRAKGCAEQFDRFYLDSLKAYLAAAMASPEIGPRQKRETTKQYVDGLFQNGGPSTDAFVKAIGREAAEKLFHTVVFGIGEEPAAPLQK